MIRFVLDTNVLISATIVKGGAPSQILQAWRGGELELVTSPVLLNELEEVLMRRRIQKHQWMTREEVFSLLDRLRRSAIQTSGMKKVSVIAEDPDDDFVLSAALEGHADYIVSDDHHLKDLNTYQGIRIVSPAEFLKLL